MSKLDIGIIRTTNLQYFTKLTGFRVKIRIFKLNLAILLYIKTDFQVGIIWGTKEKT